MVYKQEVLEWGAENKSNRNNETISKIFENTQLQEDMHDSFESEALSPNIAEKECQHSCEA